ncbi:unnamed protein product [Coregonus sp. 'balchen']|nr:unnamed protein product [Coregonus sp. 'balchen']
MKKGKKHQQSTGSRENGNGNTQRHGEHESWKKLKLVEIHQALNSDPVDIETLRRAAVSEGGLLTDEIRRKVWPKLLSVNVYKLPAKPSMRVDERKVLQEQLIDSILVVLQKNPALHYYQGYHDIVVTFLLVVGERMAIAIVETLSNHHLRDFMDPTMDSTKHILNYLMPILEQFRHVLRLYDFFLASHPLMAIYFAAVIVLHREKEVKQTECDMAMVHHLLSQIPQDLPYEELITQAHCLFTLYPPSLLAKRAALQSRKRIKKHCDVSQSNLINRVKPPKNRIFHFRTAEAATCNPPSASAPPAAVGWLASWVWCVRWLAQQDCDITSGTSLSCGPGGGGLEWGLAQWRFLCRDSEHAGKHRGFGNGLAIIPLSVSFHPVLQSFLSRKK